MAVYLLHFEHKLAHAAHYVGFTENIVQRLEDHGHCKGARLMQVIREKAIHYELARVWWGQDRSFERKLKNTHAVKFYCPICMGDKVRAFTPKECPGEKVHGLSPESCPPESHGFLQAQAELEWLPF